MERGGFGLVEGGRVMTYTYMNGCTARSLGSTACMPADDL